MPRFVNTSDGRIIQLVLRIPGISFVRHHGLRISLGGVHTGDFTDVSEARPVRDCSATCNPGWPR